MTIEEAIQYCREQAEKQKKESAKRLQIGLMHAANDCEECAAEHEQLAEWLTELKQRREAEITAPPKSNGDRIRQMTDEELAAVLRCNSCLYQNMKSECESSDCEYGIISWLRKEADEDET